MAKCLICNLDVNSDDKNLIVTEIFCPHCGNYAYEKTFKTTFFITYCRRNMFKRNFIISKAVTHSYL